MTIDVSFTPNELPDDIVLSRSAVVAVDVFRASAAMCAMLLRGASQIRLFASVQELNTEYTSQTLTGILRAGEVGGLAPEEFDFGNSPREILERELFGKEILYSTTNGTKLLRRTAASPFQIVSSFVNISAALRALQEYIERESCISNILIACAGNDGSFSLEDSFFAGCLVQNYIARSSSYELTDAAQAAVCVANSYSNNLNNLIRDARHAKRLEELGFSPDVRLCLDRDAIAVVPRCSDGIVRPLR